MLAPPVLVEPDDRRLMRESVSAFVAKAGATKRVRTARVSDIGFDRDVWTEIAALGWIQASQPEAHGGMGLSFADIAALHEEYGKGALPEPLCAVGVLAAGILAQSDNEGLRLEELPRVQSGEKIAAVAWQAGPGALTSADVAIEATPQRGGYNLAGAAFFVPHAENADGFIVAGHAPEGLVLCWLPRGARGVSVETERAADFTPVSRVVFRDAVVRPEQVLAQAPEGATILDRSLDRARLAACAEAVGVMHATLDTTLEYMKTREQFGKPIGSFQGLQHRAVDLYIQLELSRSAVLRAAAAFDAGWPDTAAIVAGCKARCAEAGTTIAGQSVHLHGTIGFTEELDLSILIRRAHFLAAWLGNGPASLRRYADLRFSQGVGA